MNKQIFISSLLLITLFTQVTSRPLVAKRIVHAINAGSHMPKRSSQGFPYSRDQGYDEETNAVDYSTNAQLSNVAIKYAKDQQVYLTERHGYNTFSYQLALENEGVYTLILKFCEMYFDKPGRRVFHVRLGDQRVIVGLDLFAKSGRFVAHDEYVEFKYKGGIVTHRNQQCKNAIVDGKLVVTFEKTEQDNPIIQGIILYSGAQDTTDYQDLENWKLNWDKNQYQEMKKKSQQEAKLKESKLKKQEKIVVRNDHQDIEDDFEEVIQLKDCNSLVQQENVQEKPVHQTPPLKDMLMSPLGIVCMIGFFVVSYVLIQETFFDQRGEDKKNE